MSICNSEMSIYHYPIKFMQMPFYYRYWNWKSSNINLISIMGSSVENKLWVWLPLLPPKTIFKQW